MSATVMLHPDVDGMDNVRVVRDRFPYTALKFNAGETSLTIFFSESQLDELATVLTDAIAERVDCEECENGHVFVEWIPRSYGSPEETITEICETCDGRGWVIPTETVQ